MSEAHSITASGCGDKTEPHDRWWFRLGGPIDGGSFWGTTEAAVHHHLCALTAQRVCPHLKQLGAVPEPFPGGATVLAAIVGGMTTEHDYGVNIAGRKVIGHLKLAWRFEPRPFKSRMWL